MKETSERWGLSLEIIGMCILLLATFWDSEASGWWDNASREMQYLIQEKANLAILDSNQQIIFSEMKSLDEHRRYEQLIAASEKIAVASRELIEDRNQRRDYLKGQAALFAKIKLGLLTLGSILLIAGKGFMLNALRNQHSSKEDSKVDKALND